ncbi:MAG: MotA/TolQ/ExbB proton channel family protein [Gammaproteobacteria bacterium]|nr:MotA/TolQ/ExbB proton channel family protein [Gammaproteobacteria bacterium]
MIYFKSNYSSKVLVQMIIFAVILILGLITNFNLVWEFYFANQETMAGIVINGVIVLLFMMGIFSTAYILLHYRHEETALELFLTNLRQSPNNPTLSVATDSLIVKRYEAMVALNQRKAEINQGALAATVVASESTRLSLPRYISNILILCGVFGTIVSLSIALMGASDLIESTGDMTGMGSVIHGMSTALSTTTTAIVAYLFFGYFYQKLRDIQTNLFSALEQVCSINLMPHFSPPVGGNNILGNVDHLVKSLDETASGMKEAQQSMMQIINKLDDVVSGYDQRIEAISNNLGLVNQLLAKGFRLPELSEMEEPANATQTKKDLSHPSGLSLSQQEALLNQPRKPNI